MIGAIVGKPNLDNFLTFTVRKGTKNQSTISIGLVLTQIISLIIVGLVLFMCLKAYNKIRKPVEAAPRRAQRDRSPHPDPRRATHS